MLQCIVQMNVLMVVMDHKGFKTFSKPVPPYWQPDQWVRVLIHSVQLVWEALLVVWVAHQAVYALVLLDFSWLLMDQTVKMSMNVLSIMGGALIAVQIQQGHFSVHVLKTLRYHIIPINN